MNLTLQRHACLMGYPYRVLAVDDESFHRELEREILQAPKYRLTEACDGFEALDILARQDFDVVLLDKRMPGINGDEVCRRIRQDLGLDMLPVVMVTADSGTDDLALSMQAGASDFIRKPYHPIELISRVDAAVARKRLTDQLDSAESMLFALARMVEAKDENTGDHCSRLAHLGVELGKALGLSPEELLALRRGGVLHDIGKLGIPDAILLKPGKLDEAEWAVMRQHPVIGARLVSDLRSMRLTAPIIRHHHERWDGSGYPDGLRGEAIPLLARVFQVVDIYDALAHERPYKRALPRETVIGMLREEVARGWRDPEIVQVFLELLARQPERLALPATPGESLGIDLYESITASSDLITEAGAT